MKKYNYLVFLNVYMTQIYVTMWRNKELSTKSQTFWIYYYYIDIDINMHNWPLKCYSNFFFLPIISVTDLSLSLFIEKLRIEINHYLFYSKLITKQINAFMVTKGNYKQNKGVRKLQYRKANMWVPISSIGKKFYGWIRNLRFNPYLYQKPIGILIWW